MALTLENGNYTSAYKGHLDNKTTIKVLAFGDIYPTKYMGKTIDMFGRLKFQLQVNLLF